MEIHVRIVVSRRVTCILRYVSTTRYVAVDMPGVGDYYLERNEPPKGGRLYYEGFYNE